MVDHDFFEVDGFELRIIKIPSLKKKTVVMDLDLVNLAISRRVSKNTLRGVFKVIVFDAISIYHKKNITYILGK